MLSDIKHHQDELLTLAPELFLPVRVRAEGALPRQRIHLAQSIKAQKACFLQGSLLPQKLQKKTLCLDIEGLSDTTCPEEIIAIAFFNALGFEIFFSHNGVPERLGPATADKFCQACLTREDSAGDELSQESWVRAARKSIDELARFTLASCFKLFEQTTFGALLKRANFSFTQSVGSELLPDIIDVTLGYEEEARLAWLAYSKEDRALLLRWAILFNHLSIFEGLLASLKEERAIVQEAFFIAVEVGCESMVSALLASGVDLEVNAQNEYGHPALSVAAFHGHAQVVEALLRVAGINVNAKNKGGCTALMVAAYRGHVQVVQALLQVAGINVNEQDEEGWTALMLAAFHGHAQVVQALLRAAGINVNAKSKEGWTALMPAAQEGHVEVVEALLRVAGINVNAKHKGGGSALSVAAFHGQAQVVEALLRVAGINVNEQDEEEGRPPLMLAAFHGHAQVVEALLRVAGINVNEQDDDGCTALMLAAQSGRTAIVKLLQKHDKGQHPLLFEEALAQAQDTGPAQDDRLYLAGPDSAWERFEMYPAGWRIGEAALRNANLRLRIGYFEAGEKGRAFRLSAPAWQMAAVCEEKRVSREQVGALLQPDEEGVILEFLVPPMAGEYDLYTVSSEDQWLGWTCPPPKACQVYCQEGRLILSVPSDAPCLGQRISYALKVGQVNAHADYKHKSTLHERLAGPVNTYLHEAIRRFNQQKMTCAERSAVVCDWLTTHRPDLLPRLVAVDGNHVDVEIKINQDWFVLGLGGTSSRLVYHRESLADLEAYYPGLGELSLTNTTSLKNIRTGSCSFFLTLLCCPFTVLKDCFMFKRPLERESFRKKKDWPEVKQSLLKQAELSQEEKEERSDSAAARYGMFSRPSTTPLSVSPSRWQALAQRCQQGWAAYFKASTLDQSTLKKWLQKREGGHLLVQTREPHVFMCYLKRQNRVGQNNYHYVHEPATFLSILKPHISIEPTGQVRCHQHSKLWAWLQSDICHKVLVIDWSRFDSAQRIALSSLLDAPPSFNGVSFGDLRVCSVVETPPNDPAFMSRHGRYGHFECPSLEQDLGAGAPEQHFEIDLKGLPDWQTLCFGGVEYGSPLRYALTGSLIARLQEANAHAEGEAHIVFRNIPASSRAKFITWVEQAKAQGYFDYHGHRINILPHVQFEVESKHQALVPSLPVIDTLYSDISFSDLLAQWAESTVYVVNDQTLDEFILPRPRVDESTQTYYESPSLLSEKSAQSLSLFCTMALSPEQWYALFQTCSEHRCRLTLGFAPGVYETLPEAIKTKLSEQKSTPTFNLDALSEAEFELAFQALSAGTGAGEGAGALVASRQERLSQAGLCLSQFASEYKNRVGDIAPQAVAKASAGNAARLVLTNRPEAWVQRHLASTKSMPRVIDVEDQNFETLLYSVDYRFNQTGHRLEAIGAELRYSDLWAVLQDPKAEVVLTGQFSPALFSLLEPLLLQGSLEINGHCKPLQAKLTLVVKEGSVSRERLKGVPYEAEIFEAPIKAEPCLWQETSDGFRPPQAEGEQKEDSASDSWADDPTLPDALRSERFLHRRIQGLKTMLTASPIVQLVSRAGRGKSALLKRIGQQPGTRVFEGLEGLADWAEDVSDDEKILFLDEANLSDWHYTLFQAMLRNPDAPEVLYQGKLYRLSARHKVVFASNPDHYGSGRVEPLLFEQNPGLPRVQLNVFPDYFIRSHLLRPLREEVGEECWAECLGSINQAVEAYIKSQQGADKSSPISVRALQQKVWEIVQPAAPVRPPLTYCLHDTNRGIYHKAYQWLSQQRAKTGSMCGMGQNGFYLEGPPAAGKSALLKAALHAQGYEAGRHYVEISAGLPKAEKEHRLLAAFEKGQLVLIDELNTCIADGLEQTLNSLLTGTYPGRPSVKSKGSAQMPGFGVLATGNSPALSGRRFLSEALESRCVSCQLEAPKQEDIKHILQTQYRQALARLSQYYSQSRDQVLATVSEAFVAAREDNPAISLRALPQLLRRLFPKGSRQALQNPHAFWPSLDSRQAMLPSLVQRQMAQKESEVKGARV